MWRFTLYLRDTGYIVRRIQEHRIYQLIILIILILSSHLRLGLPSGLFPSGFTTSTLYTPLTSPIRATCPAHLIPCCDTEKQNLIKKTHTEIYCFWNLQLPNVETFRPLQITPSDNMWHTLLFVWNTYLEIFKRMFSYTSWVIKEKPCIFLPQEGSLKWLTLVARIKATYHFHS